MRAWVWCCVGEGSRFSFFFFLAAVEFLVESVWLILFSLSFSSWIFEFSTFVIFQFSLTVD